MGEGEIGEGEGQENGRTSSGVLVAHLTSNGKAQGTVSPGRVELINGGHGTRLGYNHVSHQARNSDCQTC